MLNIKKRQFQGFLKIAIVLSVVFFIFYSFDSVLAIDKMIAGFNKSADGFGPGGPPITDVPTAIGTIIGVALSFVGLAFFVLMIYGGFIWMFARGNEQDVEKAKSLIQAAIIGMVIVLSAYAITMMIGDVLTSGDSGTSSNYLENE